MPRYAIWNNKGGVGKTFLAFVLGTEIAKRDSDEKVILVDMCPQANLSEIVLGGNQKGLRRWRRFWEEDQIGSRLAATSIPGSSLRTGEQAASRNMSLRQLSTTSICRTTFI